MTRGADSTSTATSATHVGGSVAVAAPLPKSLVPPVAGPVSLRKRLALAFAVALAAALVLAVVNHLEYRSLALVDSASAMGGVQAALDSGAPFTMCSADGLEHSSPYVVTFTVVSADVKIADTFYSVDGGPFVAGMLVELATGTHSLRFYSTDVGGNVEATKSVTVTVR